MATIKAKWKRAPRDQRRLASERTAPKARFTRKGLSGSLPPPLPSGGGGRSSRPLLIFAGVLIVLVAVSITVVIAVGTFIRAEQQYEDMQWRAAYYGRPTQPFSTLAPDADQQQQVVTDIPMLTTPLPGVLDSVLSASSADAALTEPDGAADGSKSLSSFCAKFGVPVSIRIFDWDDWSTVSLTNPLVAQLPLSWDARPSFWQGYNSAKPFNQPADTRDRWRLQLFTQDGLERWIQIAESASTPDLLYVYAFQIITPYRDSQGRHFGYHPCRAFTVPSDQMAILLSSAGAYQSSGSHFPDFAAAGDPRWVQGNATPINGGFDLRSIPTILNNQPLKTVSETVSCYFITDVDWGAWAQIKLSNTIAWVDTSSVRLDAS